jgi:integrase
MILEKILARHVADLELRGTRNSIQMAKWHGKMIMRVLGPDYVFGETDEDPAAEIIGVRREDGVSDVTINAHLRVLKAACNLSEIPHKIRLLRTTSKLPTTLTPEQVTRLCLNAPNRTVRLALLLAARAGLRHQEILHLTRRDVSFVTAEIFVRAKPDAWEPKNHEERVVPFNPYGALGQLLKEFCVHDMKPGDWIFENTRKTGRCLDLGPEVRIAFRKAGLYNREDRPGLHMLRRTFASQLLANGADLNTVRELGGWASLAVMQRYLRSATALKRTAVDSLD